MVNCSFEYIVVVGEVILKKVSALILNPELLLISITIFASIFTLPLLLMLVFPLLLRSIVVKLFIIVEVRDENVLIEASIVNVPLLSLFNLTSGVFDEEFIFVLKKSIYELLSFAVTAIPFVLLFCAIILRLVVVNDRTVNTFCVELDNGTISNVVVGVMVFNPKYSPNL